jgi:uncharacterized membrane-anchored protein
MHKMLYLFILVCTSFNCLTAEDAIGEERDETLEKILALGWEEAGTHKLALSNSTLSLESDYHIVLGNDAHVFSSIVGCTPDQALEAVVCDSTLNNSIYFESYNEGYVTLDDWKDIDAEAFIREMSKNTENNNIERRKLGFSELHVTGWLKKPTLDRDTNCVYWVTELENGQNQIVNSVALRLGRKGYEKIIWVTDKESYTPVGGILELMLKGHSFDPGYRYSDYTIGDTVASYGIASLVAASIGTKILKSGVILVFLKKFGMIFFSVAMFIWYKIKNWFKKRKEDQPALVE